VADAVRRLCPFAAHTTDSSGKKPTDYAAERHSKPNPAESFEPLCDAVVKTLNTKLVVSAEDAAFYLARAAPDEIKISPRARELFHQISLVSPPFFCSCTLADRATAFGGRRCDLSSTPSVCGIPKK
jgi:hypothetical protein